MTAPPDLLADPVPGLGPEIRPGALDESAVAALVAGRPAREPDLLLACALLWHDRLEAAHAIVQRREGELLPDTLHAIMHRREPDEGNSRWWWARVGRHPCADALGAEAVRLGLAELRRSDGGLDAPAMARACCRRSLPAPALAALQACELRLLAGMLLAP